MLTPQEVLERRDNLEKAVFGGYSVGSVEELLDPLQEDYAALYKENAVLKSKMKVLVEKLEEYRDREDGIKNALLKAQSAADEMVANAERRSAQMLVDSEQRLRQRSQELSAEVLAEQERVTMAKQSAARFIAELEERVQEQLTQLEKIKQMDLEPEAAAKAQSRPAAPAEHKTPTRLVPEARPEPKPADQGEMAQEIGASITRILEESAKGEDAMGDTRVIDGI